MSKPRNFGSSLLLGRPAFASLDQSCLLTIPSRQILSLALTGENTTSQLLANNKVSIPALQLMPNYFLLASIYGSYTIYKLGFKGWLRLFLKDGWRYLILAFIDVEGNYFTVLAYRYTTILQAQLINIWAIAIVVFISLVFLKVRCKCLLCVLLTHTH